jgi:hypothetical protein
MERDSNPPRKRLAPVARIQLLRVRVDVPRIRLPAMAHAVVLVALYRRAKPSAERTLPGFKLGMSIRLGRDSGQSP